VVTVALLDAENALSEASMAMALERLAGRALAYGGVVQCRHNRIRMVALEMPAAASRDAAHDASIDYVRTIDRGSSQALT